MITKDVKYEINYTFEKLKEAFNRVEISDAKDYFLTLGNVNEVWMMRKDAKKSIFLGRLFDVENTTKETEARKIWNGIQAYFKGTTQTTQETKVEVVHEKKVRKPKKVVEPVVPVVEEIDVEPDEDSDWVDAVL